MNKRDKCLARARKELEKTLKELRDKRNRNKGV
jgi:hypothetical protein